MTRQREELRLSKGGKLDLARNAKSLLRRRDRDWPTAAALYTLALYECASRVAVPIVARIIFQEEYHYKGPQMKPEIACASRITSGSSASPSGSGSSMRSRMVS